MPLGDKCHQLDETPVRSDQIANDVSLARYDIYGGNIDGAAVPDDEMRPGSPGEVPAQRFGALLSNEVENYFGARLGSSGTIRR